MHTLLAALVLAQVTDAPPAPPEAPAEEAEPLEDEAPAPAATGEESAPLEDDAPPAAALPTPPGPAAAAAGGKAIEEISLEDLLGRDVAAGKSGSFGYRLQEYGVAPYLHAYTVVEWNIERDKVNTFDLHYFNLFVGANIRNLAVPEMQVEYEHGGSEIKLRYAQLDVRVFGDTLQIRGGRFLVPFGVFNEFLYPEFISQLPDRPLALREIIPVSWAEVGVQARGRWSWDERQELGVDYALYLVNGLEQRDDVLSPKIDDGGSIRDMRDNLLDEHNDDKAIGGRLGLRPIPGLSVGVSGYTGAYSVDGAQRLSLGGADATLQIANFQIQSEYVVGHQTTARGDILKLGGHVLVTFQLFDQLAPVFQIDHVRLGGAPEQDRVRLTAGAVVLPFANDVYNLVLKPSFAITTNEGNREISWRGVVQAALGF